MREKYLPIGTVCTIKNEMNKYMIVGYYSLEYLNELKVYDYVACPYPDGIISNKNKVSFNHSDIIQIDFLGYESSLYIDFNNFLLKHNISVDSVKKKDDASQLNQSNYIFDENGVVVLDNLNKVDNPFVYNDSVKSDSVQLHKPQIGNYTFDENGVVVSDEKDTTTSNYTFDENGVVVSDGKDATTSNYTFDENGVVVSDGKDTTTSNYTFNENGVVVSDGKDAASPNYIFDENGVVVSQ